MSPDTELLRSQGWTIISCNGPYCLAWMGSREVLLLWKNGGWFQIYEVSRESRLAG
jgi:hypothetical protein